MKQTKRNFRLDAIMFVAFLFTTTTGPILWLVIPRQLGIAFLGFSRSAWRAAHVYSGVVVLAGIVLHIIRHRDWLRALRGRRLSGMPEKLRLNRVVDRIMWITYIAANVFGVTAWALSTGNDISVVGGAERLHAVFGAACTILVSLHLALHWKWVASTTRRYLAPAPGWSR
jgi:hypothetical protein